MTQLKHYVIQTTSAIGAVLLGLIGGWDKTIEVLLVFMAVDFLTGLMVAFSGKSPKTRTGGFSSKTCFQSLTRKLLVMVMLVVAVSLDTLLGLKGVCRFATTGFYAANEGLSILENVALLGLPLPGVLLRALEILKQKSDADNHPEILTPPDTHNPGQ